MKTHPTLSKATLKLSLTIVSLVLFVSSNALAHPGHGVDHDHPWSALHFLGSSQHAILIVFGLAVVGFVALKMTQARRKSMKSRKQN